MAVNNPRVIAAPQDFRSVINNTGATLVKGTVVKLKTTVDDEVVLPAAISDPAFGVVTADILDKGVGTVQIRGRCACIAGTAGVVRGDKLTHDSGGTFGRVFTAAPAGGTNNALIGLATRTQATVGGLVEVELAGPGAFFQG